jgi:calcineurin-like phosphoesterase family protein
MLFFTSDTHFFHGNIIKYCNRPYSNVIEMNYAIIDKWNSVVAPSDTVYHLGDFNFGGKSRTKECLDLLNGNKILIKGNHDFSAEWMQQSGFKEVYNEYTLNTDFGEIFLKHHPSPKTQWDSAEYHFCGHVHEKWKRDGNMINVGVDVWDYTPRTIEELLAC